MGDEKGQDKGFAWLPPRSSFEMVSVGSLPDEDQPEAPPGTMEVRRRQVSQAPCDVPWIVLPENFAVKKKRNPDVVTKQLHSNFDLFRFGSHLGHL